VDVLNWKPRAARLEGKVYVEKKLVCEATIMCQVVPRPGKVVSEDLAAPEATPALETVNHE
jgi:3-hydroxyacyl-[acyl-carrier-protein] dehydratase